MIRRTISRCAGPKVLWLYVAGNEASSASARRSLDELLENPEFVGQLRSVVIDVLREPQRAKAACLSATPTLLVRSGGRAVRFIGDLSSIDSLIEFLQSDLQAARR